MTRYNQSTLFRDGANPMVSGVCGGLAKYLDINPLWVRGATAVSFLFFPFAIALAYVLAVLLLKKRIL